MDNEKYTTSAKNADNLKIGFRVFAGNIGPDFMQYVFDRNGGDYMTPLALRYEQLKSHMRFRLRRINDPALLSLSDSLTPCIISNEIWNEWVVSIGFPELARDPRIVEDFIVEKVIRQYFYIKGLDSRYIPEILYRSIKEYITLLWSDCIMVKEKEIAIEGNFFNELMRVRNLDAQRVREILKENRCTIQDQKDKTTSHRTFIIDGQKEYRAAIVLKTEINDNDLPTEESETKIVAGKQLKLELIPCDDGDLPF